MKSPTIPVILGCALQLVLSGPALCRDQQAACDVHAVFSAAQEALLRELGGTTLAQVLERGLEPTLAEGSERSEPVQEAAG